MADGKQRKPADRVKRGYTDRHTEEKTNIPLVNSLQKDRGSKKVD
jgi:hypothetical protein